MKKHQPDKNSNPKSSRQLYGKVGSKSIVNSGDAIDQAFNSPSPATVVSTSCTTAQSQDLCLTQRRKSTSHTHSEQLLLNPKTDERSQLPPINMKRRRISATPRKCTYIGLLIFLVVIISLPSSMKAYFLHLKIKFKFGVFFALKWGAVTGILTAPRGCHRKLKFERIF